jgi:hypothetical protein
MSSKSEVVGIARDVLDGLREDILAIADVQAMAELPIGCALDTKLCLIYKHMYQARKLLEQFSGLYGQQQPQHDHNKC